MEFSGQNPFVRCAVAPYVKLQYAEMACPIQYTSIFATRNPTDPPAPVVPLPPTNITVSNITPSSFVVTWSAASFAQSYNIVWGEYHFSTTNLTFTLTGLPQGTTNTLYVYAHNEDGNTPGTPQTVSTTYYPPAVPTGLIASNITYNSFTLNWTAAQYATGYTAQWFGSTPPTNGVVTGTSAVFSGLPSASSGICIVTATSPGGSAQSAPYPVSTLVAPPSAPTNLVAQNIAVNSFTVSFDYSGAPATFGAVWTVGSTPYYATIAGTGPYTATFSNLPGSSTGNVIVNATNVSGTSGSTPLGVTTGGLPPKPTGVAATLWGTNYFFATFTVVPGYTYSATWGTYNGSIVGNTISFSGLVPVGGNANLIVTATNQYGSTPSDPVPVTLRSPITITYTGGLANPPYPNGPDTGVITTFTIPADFDYNNNNAMTNPNFIDVRGSLVGYDPNQPSGTNISYYMRMPPNTATNSYGFLTVQGSNLDINSSGWNTQVPWSLYPNQVWSFEYGIGAGNGLLDTTNIKFRYTYNPVSP